MTPHTMTRLLVTRADGWEEVVPDSLEVLARYLLENMPMRLEQVLRWYLDGANGELKVVASTPDWDETWTRVADSDDGHPAV